MPVAASEVMGSPPSTSPCVSKRRCSHRHSIACKGPLYSQQSSLVVKIGQHCLMVSLSPVMRLPSRDVCLSLSDDHTYTQPPTPRPQVQAQVYIQAFTNETSSLARTAWFGKANPGAVNYVGWVSKDSFPLSLFLPSLPHCYPSSVMSVKEQEDATPKKYLVSNTCLNQVLDFKVWLCSLGFLCLWSATSR